MKMCHLLLLFSFYLSDYFVVRARELISPKTKAQFPPLRYKFTSFATPTPEEAAAFCEKYFGAEVLNSREDFLTHKDVSPEARVTGVRFHYKDNPFYKAVHEKPSFTDVYFVYDSTKPTGNLTVSEFADFLHRTHRFDLEEAWDWYQDWHLAFYVEDLDLLLYRLVRDSIPVVTRGSSFYVEIPRGLTFQFLGKKMDLVWTELFSFCRVTTGRAERQPMQIADLPEELPPIPELIPPSHHSFFSNDAIAAMEFVTAFTSGRAVDLRPQWQLSHRYSDGRCAQLAWVEFEEYQVHFVEQFRKYEGEGLPTREVERELTALHGNMTRPDAFFDNHVGFLVDDLGPFLAELRARGAPHLARGRSLYMMLPGGIIFHLVESPPAAAGAGVSVA